MRIPIDQITAAPKELSYAEAVGDLNARLAQGGGGLRAHEGMSVELQYYRAGLDVVVEGGVDGVLSAPCGRCLVEYDLPIALRFRVVLTPKATEEMASGEIADEDMGLGFFEGDVIDVTDIVHEQVLLGLPSSLVCSPQCRGLCPRCGTNLNDGSCVCAADGPRPRLAILHDLLRNRSAQR